MNDRPNPLTDFLTFATAPAWTTLAFWILLIGSCTFAVMAWRRDPAQRTLRHLGLWAIRLLVGGMWWQQTLWKIPPNYDGLIYWMTELTKHAAIPLHGDLVARFLLPNMTLFGPFIYLMEVAIGASLMLGLFSRAGALLGMAMAVNLWLGLYSAPGEWPWTYMFLILIQAAYAIDPPGRILGADRIPAIARHRLLRLVI